MFIDLKQLTEKYKFTPSRILHVGAHEAEELESYVNCGAKYVFWVEGNQRLCENLKRSLDPKTNQVIEGLVSDKSGEEIVFNIANNSQCSSILDLGSHKHLFPSVSFTSKETKITTTLDEIINRHMVGVSIDFLNIDIQGAELKALKGLKQNIHKVQNIYLEVNTEEVYKGCALMGEIDDFLLPYGFKRVETKMYSNHPWGDAFYIR